MAAVPLGLPAWWLSVPWKRDLGNGTDIPKSGMTARPSTKSEEEDLIFG